MCCYVVSVSFCQVESIVLGNCMAGFMVYVNSIVLLYTQFHLCALKWCLFVYTYVSMLCMC